MPDVAARTISTASYPSGTLAHAAMLQRMRRDGAAKCVPGPLGYDTTNDDDKFPSCSTSVPEITRSCCAQGTVLTDTASVPTNGVACIPIASLTAASAQVDLDAAWKAFEDCARKAHGDICPAGTGFDVQCNKRKPADAPAAPSASLQEEKDEGEEDCDASPTSAIVAAASATNIAAAINAPSAPLTLNNGASGHNDHNNGAFGRLGAAPIGGTVQLLLLSLVSAKLLFV